MGYAVTTAAPQLGSWLSDAVGWVEDHTGGGSSGPFTPGGVSLPGRNTPGWSVYLPGTETDTTTGGLYDDLQIIQVWKDAVIAEGGVPSRMGPGPYEGELCERSSGPGTSFPSASPPFTMTLAPANVIAADHRATAVNQPAVDAIVPRATGGFSLPTLPGLNLKWVLVAAAVALGAVVLVPMLAPSARVR